MRERPLALLFTRCRTRCEIWAIDLRKRPIAAAQTAQPRKILLALGFLVLFPFLVPSFLETTSTGTFSLRSAPLSKNVTSDIFYSKTRRDRSGAVVHDMLFAHAYAFAHNKTYGGACGRKGGAAHALLRELGLQTVLPFACPRNPELILSGQIYRKEELFTDAWLSHLRSQLPESLREPNANAFQIVVHIRRDDVRVCNTADRYLPNQHFLELIERHRPQNGGAYEVTIFSNAHSSSTFQVFADRNYTVKLDTPLHVVWKRIMSADLVIMSKSSFSAVPSMLNARGTVIYTPFWHRPLPGWVAADEAVLNRTSAALETLRAELCPEACGWWIKTYYLLKNTRAGC